jgi:hypothetical protein
VPAAEIARRLRVAGIVGAIDITAANRAISRGRLVADVDEPAPAGGVPAPSIMTVDEQLDALAAGEEVATPLRGMLALWRDMCRDDEQECGPQFCQCGELIVRCAPTEFPWASTEAGRVARWSHLDGSPVCPRMGPDGYEPAEPYT